MRRGDSGRLRLALAASALVHLALVGVFWQVARSSAETPRMRVYAVDIVSPPPRELGEFSPEPAGEPAPVAQPEPEPVEAPEPEPTPPPEPSPAPKATNRPAPKETPKETPKAAPKEQPKAPAPKETPQRSTGARPDPTSAGGENLDVRTEGARFVDPAYLENIVRQLYRYFRAPPGSVSDAAEVRFTINRDGSVSEIELVRASGSFRFRTAAMEAVEQAGGRKAFGPLPRAYPADRLPVAFTFEPQ